MGSSSPDVHVYVLELVGREHTAPGRSAERYQSREFVILATSSLSMRLLSSVYSFRRATNSGSVVGVNDSDQNGYVSRFSKSSTWAGIAGRHYRQLAHAKEWYL